MRLLHSSKYQLREFTEPDKIPPYAMLSHSWQTDEVSLRDFQTFSLNEFRDSSINAKRGLDKIMKCCDQAQLDKIEWVWIDTCCLDRPDSEETSEAINSMYRWFENAAVCYAYLSDVSSSKDQIRPMLRKCRYFTRKWTLQELVAPRSVEFFAEDWVKIGTRSSLHDIISEITGIPSAVLIGEKKPKQCHVSERMSWAANRTATRVEDEAYAIMGLFDIQMPILYGEGNRAFRRLQDEISKTHYSSMLDTARTGMRLLVTSSNSLEIKNFSASDSPEFAILSHTWGSPDDEVSFTDIREGKAESKRCYQKVMKSCELAAKHGFEYIWIDTCCIDKSSSAELQEAICSMYRWYKNARICYVYLEDVDYLNSPDSVSLWESRWFTRGWTLQELIAPAFVEFYDKEWKEIGTKSSLCEHISAVTGIDAAVLRGSDPTKRTIAERMSWAAKRSTTRIEDAAYCLMGLFNVFMPMLYGEGSRAFTRLQEEIMKKSEDYTIFAWKASFMSSEHRGLLAHSPDEFLGGASVTSRKYEAEHEPEHPPTMTSRGLLIDLPIVSELLDSWTDTYMAWIGSPKHTQSKGSLEEGNILCIWLYRVSSSPQTFVRVFPGKLEVLPRSDSHRFKKRRIYVLPFGTTIAEERQETNKTRSGMLLVYHSRDFGVHLAIPPLISGDPVPRIEWNSSSNELLYSYDKDNCLLATFVLQKNKDKYLALIGFRNNLPWCSVVSLGELEYSTTQGVEYPEAIQKRFDETGWLLRQTDRSSRRLPDGSMITAAFRVGCPTPINPTVFNFQICWENAPEKALRHPDHQLIFAPTHYTKNAPTVFLSGYIDQPSTSTWQATLSASLLHLPITILNPHRPDWDSSWRETPSFTPFTEQVNWELDGLEKADVIVICFGAKMENPITLMELGLFAKSGKCVVACPEGYPKRGNVQVLCATYGIRILDSALGLPEAIVKKLMELGKL